MPTHSSRSSLANCDNFKAMDPQMRKDSVDKLRTTKCCLKKGGKQHDPADCRTLCKWMVGLLEDLLVLLLEVLLDCGILLDSTEVLVTSSYNVLICLEFEIVVWCLL